MSTDVEVCNQALSLLGDKKITDLDGTDNLSVTCKNHYQRTVDWVLKQREWRCAVKRATLTTPATPNHGWSYAYDLPSDHLRTLAVRDSSLKDDDVNALNWQQEDGKIVCDTDTQVYLKYLYRVAVADIPTHVEDVIITLLASRLAIPVADSRSLRDDLKAEYKEMIGEAAAVDGMQGRTRQLRTSRIARARANYGNSNVMGPYV